MFHNALLHLMRVAATKQTTFTISLKCCAPAFAAGHASQPNTPSDSISVQSMGKGRSAPPEIAWGSDILSRVVYDVNQCSPAGLDSHAF
jgi:hypothetical protein